jgi:hypothetical protein
MSKNKLNLTLPPGSIDPIEPGPPSAPPDARTEAVIVPEWVKYDDWKFVHKRVLNNITSYLTKKAAETKRNKIDECKIFKMLS